jgi:hypothetical protein
VPADRISRRALAPGFETVSTSRGVAAGKSLPDNRPHIFEARAFDFATAMGLDAFSQLRAELFSGHVLAGRVKTLQQMESQIGPPDCGNARAFSNRWS